MKKRARKQKRNDFLPLLLIGAGVAPVVGVLVWQATRSVQTAIPGTAGQTANTERVTLAQAKAAYDAGEAVFLDVRDSGSYAAGHIPGAVNIPLAMLQNRANELDPNQWIITYCTWPAEESSARAALILRDLGFQQVNPILGGWAAWENAGLPKEP